MGHQAGPGHRRVWSGVAPPEHSGGRPSRSRGGTVSPGAGGARLCTGGGARLGQSHRLPILGPDPAGILRRRRPLAPGPRGQYLIDGHRRRSRGGEEHTRHFASGEGHRRHLGRPGDMSVSMGLRGDPPKKLLPVRPPSKEFGVPCATGATADDVAMPSNKAFHHPPPGNPRSRGTPPPPITPPKGFPTPPPPPPLPERAPTGENLPRARPSTSTCRQAVTALSFCLATNGRGCHS